MPPCYIVVLIMVVLDCVLVQRTTYSSTQLFQITRGADKSLAQPGRKQATATEDFDVNISYL